MCVCVGGGGVLDYLTDRVTCMRRVLKYAFALDRVVVLR